MTGQIPPYGKYFRRENVQWDSRIGTWEINGVNFGSRMASRRYVLKEEPRWFIWSSNNSEKWGVFYTSRVAGPRCVLEPFPTMRAAMAFLTGKDEADFLPKKRTRNA